MKFLLARVPKPLLLVLLALVRPHVPVVSALQGDSWCGTLMCVEAIVNTSTVTYELKALNQLGWMAIGFGSTMANTPMVILWQAANGTTILSQRQASGRIEPLPVTHPPRLASLSPRANVLSSVAPVLAFNVPRNKDTVQSLIWAFGLTIPDASPNAPLEQHLDAGALSLNLTKELDDASESPPSSVTISQLGAASSTTTPAPPTSQSSPVSASNGAARASNLLVVHAVLSAAGFLILLPMGTLVARWSRIFTSKWFTAHWFINVVLGIPFICVGWALGPLAVAQQGREHIVTAHQICGVVLFVLYIMEVAVGTLIHLRRPKHGRAHPPRNVLHVVLGLALFGLSIYETVNGIDRDPAVSSVSQTTVVATCIGWAAVFSATYSIGLVFLRKQFAQERLGWHVPSRVPLPLPIIAPAVRAPNESARRRTPAHDSPMADDGTHDMFSEPWTNEIEGWGGEARDSTPPAAEMRQVQLVPVSLSAFR